jgi:hypothetical protein
LLLLWESALHPMLSVAVVSSLATLSTTIVVSTSVATTTTHSVVSLTHTSFHLLKDVLTMLNELLEFVLELHHLLIHNL